MAEPIRPLPEIEQPEPTVVSDADRKVVSKRRYSRSKFRRPIVLVPLALVLVVASVLLWRYFGSYESTDDAQVDVHLYPVSARISGYVIKVNVNDNQYVKQGTVLVEIDPKDYQVAVDKAQADLGNAEATAQCAEHQCSDYLGQHLEPVDVGGVGRRKRPAPESSQPKSSSPPPTPKWSRRRPTT